MQRIKASGIVSVMPPVQENSYDPGYFSNGNPATGELATMMTAEWCNGVQEELINVISKSGLTPDQTELDQLWQAIQKLFSTSDAEKMAQIHDRQPCAYDIVHASRRLRPPGRFPVPF